MAKVLWYLGHEICCFGGSSLNLCTLEVGTHTPPFPQIQASLPSYILFTHPLLLFFMCCVKLEGEGFMGIKGPTQGGSECGPNSPKKPMPPTPPPQGLYTVVCESLWFIIIKNWVILGGYVSGMTRIFFYKKMPVGFWKSIMAARHHTGLLCYVRLPITTLRNFGHRFLRT